MRTKTQRSTIQLILVGALLVLTIGLTLAYVEETYDGQYTLSGTPGQPDAGIASGGAYTLHGGFWQGIGAAIQEFLVHLPLVIR